MTPVIWLKNDGLWFFFQYYVQCAYLLLSFWHYVLYYSGRDYLCKEKAVKMTQNCICVFVIALFNVQCEDGTEE